MDRFSLRGGAWIGGVSATWPLASMQVEPGALTVSAFGEYTFTPSEVDAIEPIGSLPILSTGIRIHHTKPNYPERIIFYSGGRRESLLHAVRAAGFRVGQPTFQHERGSPVKISAIVVFVLIWNALVWFGRDSSGKGFLLALAFAFVVSTLLPYSSRLQNLIMQDGRDVGEIRNALRLFQLITGIGLVLMIGGVTGVIPQR